MALAGADPQEEAGPGVDLAPPMRAQSTARASPDKRKEEEEEKGPREPIEAKVRPPEGNTKIMVKK